MRIGLVQEFNHISDEIKKLEERAEALRQFHTVKLIFDEYHSLSGRKKEKYKKANSISLDEYHTLSQKILELYPDGRVPSVEKHEKRIAELTDGQIQKNAEYKAAKQKADELSQAARKIDDYLRQEQSRDQ